MWTHASFCQELIVLPRACVFRHLVQPIANLYVFYLSKCHTKQDFSSDIISLNFIYNPKLLMGFLKSLEFYHSHPSAGNKQSVHIVSFPARCTRSRLFFREHDDIYASPTALKFVSMDVNCIYADCAKKWRFRQKLVERWVPIDCQRLLNWKCLVCSALKNYWILIAQAVAEIWILQTEAV